jgi:ribosomal protein S18 acetylase RimI-like enzyme
MAIRIVDVTDDATFALLPPCADPGFDHRSCDYWEDADRGSKAARASWLRALAPAAPAPRRPRNPFALDDEDDAPRSTCSRHREAGGQPLPRRGRRAGREPVRARPVARPTVAPDARPGCARWRAARGVREPKVLLEDDEPAAYAQFGPLSAYPRAPALRRAVSALPDSPLPAVITCIATTADARDRGLAAMLVEAVCDDLAGRGFAAVETYPEVGARPDATSAAQPGFWERLGFVVAAPDERFPVMRRELG